MYYPYFRGKQYDLITIRDTAKIMAEMGFIPIIEPVKEALSGLMRSIEAVNAAGGSMILIVNPANGYHVDNCGPIHELCSGELSKFANISPAYILSSNSTLQDVSAFCETYSGRRLTFIHNGFPNAKALAEHLSGMDSQFRHVFIEERCGILYTKHFKGTERVLIRDGFEKRANREHPEIEVFSDLHATYEERGMTGFGDFLIVGDEFSTTGGPAYAVAIHLTCVDDDNDDVMLVHHFKSDRFDTPTDPAGKFSEALVKLVREIERGGTKVVSTPAVDEFHALHLTGHFPGLGYVKKLSMNHHIQTMANYFKK
jgi:hypothetical protein